MCRPSRSGQACLFDNFDDTHAHGFEFVLRKAVVIEDAVHCSESWQQRVTELLAVDLDGAATQVDGSAQARQVELDAVVDLVEEEGPVRPMPVELLQE